MRTFEKTQRFRRGFVLILVLALLFAATLLLARMATHSIRLKSEAATAVATLQHDWAVWSTAHVVLPRSETLLSLADKDLFRNKSRHQKVAAGREPSGLDSPGESRHSAAVDSDFNVSPESMSNNDSKSSTFRQEIRISGQPLNVTVVDLDARLNLNAVDEIGGVAAVRNLLSQSLPEFDSNVRTFNERADGRALYSTWADAIDVEAASHDRSITDVYDAACAELTCWGSGQLNLDRCSDEQLMSLGRLLGRASIMQQIIRERRKSPDATIASLTQSLQLREEDATIVQRYLSDQSTCWGLLIRSDNGGPEVFLVRYASSGAYRSRTLCFRMQ